MSLYTYLFYFGSLFFLAFGWEHYARKHNSDTKPSVFITWLAEWAQFCWNKVGQFLAWISSFFTLIDFFIKIVNYVKGRYPPAPLKGG